MILDSIWYVTYYILQTNTLLQPQIIVLESKNSDYSSCF